MSRIPNAAFVVQSLHRFALVAPPHGRRRIPEPFVGHVRSRIWTRHIIKLISTAPVIIVVSVLAGQILVPMHFTWYIPRELFPSRVEKQGVCHPTPSATITVGRRPLPRDLVAEIFRPEDAV